MRIILGSKSPRRKEILTNAGYKFEVVVSDVDENVSEEDIKKRVKLIAKKKGEAIFQFYQDDLVISADTIVIINDIALGKPRNKKEAYDMIKLLQGKMHQVYTAVWVKTKNKEVDFLTSTKVFITKMTDEEIDAYINTTEPYDKAGGYAIQGIFAKYIDSIDGDYYNVMGLPICKLNQVLKEFI